MVLNAVDRDGMMQGMDMDLISRATGAVNTIDRSGWREASPA